MAFAAKIEINGLGEVVATRKGSRKALFEKWHQSALRVSEKTVRTVQTKFRNGPTTTEERTKVITGNLKGSYAHDVRKQHDGVSADIGVMRKWARGKALGYAYAHEFDPPVGRKARPKGGAIRTAFEMHRAEFMRRLEADSMSVLGGQA